MSGSPLRRPRGRPLPTPEATAVWTQAPDGGDRSLPVPVAASETFTLDIDAMTRALVPAVSRRTTGADGGADAVISVPTPTGELVRFAVTPVEVLADRLQQANSQIRTFAGRGVDDVGLTIRADITPLGFHAMIRSADGRTKAWFVDPATVGDDSRHVSYAAGASDLPRLQEPERGAIEEGPESPPTADVGDRETTVASRTVRLALANDPAFASFYGTDNVLAAKVSIVNRVAGVFNEDLGVRLVLSEGTDRLNFDTDAAATQPGGACGPDACFTPEALRGCEVETLRQNSAAVAGIVGNDAYDVGHTVLGGGGGSIAGTARWVWTSSRAAAAPAVPPPWVTRSRSTTSLTRLGISSEPATPSTPAEVAAVPLRSSRARDRRSWPTPGCVARTICRRIAIRTSRTRPSTRSIARWISASPPSTPLTLLRRSRRPRRAPSRFARRSP